jgi:hypothetical protein
MTLDAAHGVLSGEAGAPRLSLSWSVELLLSIRAALVRCNSGAIRER